MKINYTKWTWVCLALCVPLMVLLLQRPMAEASTPVVRVATFNAALNRPAAGDLLAELRGGDSEQARQIAEIVQRNRVDVLLLCELDRDEAAATAEVFAAEYLAKSQSEQAPIDFEFRYAGPVNTGVQTGLDLDGDGVTGGPGDAYGYGAHPGQYGMAVFSRHPILFDEIRTFQKLAWSAMPGALRPDGYYSDEVWQQLRLSSKSHWDVPVGLPGGRRLHLLCSHPTPPVFDGEEDRNGRRNHDEIRFWVDYLSADDAGWIVDDRGQQGGLAADAEFAILGDLNCDPADGDGVRDALLALLADPRVTDPLPGSAGAAEAAGRQWGTNASQQGDAALDTGDFPDQPGDGPGSGPGNLRIDYVLVSSNARVMDQAVFWPQSYEPIHRLVAASDHRLVWVDIAASAAQ